MGVLRIATVVLLALSVARGTALQAQTRLAVPSYQDPGTSTWQGWIAPGSATVGITIVDISNGDDPTYYASVDAAIQSARKQGIYVIGYTHTTYGTRDPSLVRQAIDNVYQNYLVDGIFFDEAAVNCNDANAYAGTQFLYYEELTNYVRQKQVGARLTVLNPGTYSPNDCWMSITNILMNWENSGGFSAYQTGYVDYPWVHQYPADRFWHVVLGVPQSQMQSAINLAQSRNAGWVYISDSPDNAYNQVPVYWSAEAAAITQQGVQAPFASAWPNSSTSTGTTMNAQVSFRWRAVNGAVWHIFLDTDRSARTGYRGSGLAVGAEYMLEGSASSGAQLYRYTGSGTNWSWKKVSANAQIVFPDPGINLVLFDQAAMGSPAALNYQIQSLDAAYNLLYSSYTYPLSLTNTGMVLDIMNHAQ
ncbi:MAG TPA: spherulation-specific family 4 protein [Terriglobales bacterium]|nr:spherulation-specific family 4 protein [Terriglobales bacterium]